jgi:hypothetical protein
MFVLFSYVFLFYTYYNCHLPSIIIIINNNILYNNKII